MSKKNKSSEKQPEASRAEPPEAPPGATLAERASVLVSALLVLALVAAVIYAGVTQDTRPAVLVIEPRLDEIRQAGQHYHLPVSVQNTGGQTVEEVHVRVTLAGPAGATETADFVLAFLAGGETLQGVVVFGGDPRAGEVTTTASFAEP